MKVMDLAKELGVTSKDLVVALEEMGQKGMRAMSPLPVTTANELRVKLGRGRDLPVESKPRRVAKPKEAGSVEETAEVSELAVATEAEKEAAVKRPRVLRPAKVDVVAEPVPEPMKPAATIFRPSPVPPPPVETPPVAAPLSPPAPPAPVPMPPPVV